MSAPAGNADTGSFDNKVTAAGKSSYTSGGPRIDTPGVVNALFFQAIEKRSLPNALMYKKGDKWESISHASVLERVRHTALGLSKLGIKPGDRVAILSENRPEWAIADYACICSGIIDVPIYPTLPAEQIPYIINDSGAKAIFVSSAQQAQKIAAIRHLVPDIACVIGFEEKRLDGCDMSFSELQESGAMDDNAESAVQFKEKALAVKPDHLLTLIYTSGTTGDPKGVMLTHDNVYSNCNAAENSIPLAGGDIALSFLPLSHIFERMGDYYLFANGVTIAYAESIDAVPVNMQEVKPTLMMSVPRLYEKIYSRVLDNAVSSGGLKAGIFFWARRTGERWSDVVLSGKKPSALLAMQYGLAQKLVFSKLKERTGGRLRFFVSGGAPLSPEINKFFYSAGLTILEGYGLTESSPVISANTMSDFRIGTVGKPIAGVEVLIANDGEILTRGPHVMKGYYNAPEATAEVIDSDGWLHTGDIGEIEDGFLRITDRKKDIIVTAGGKNIAPQPIENKIRNNKYVSQAVMIGDRRKYPVVLIVPDWEQLEKWCKARDIAFSNRSTLINNPDIQSKIEREVNKELDGLASYETPKKVALIEHDFSIERGELTPKLSVRRRVVGKNYEGLIESLYEKG